MKSIKKPRINNQIFAPEVRVIDKDSENLGILKIDEALQKAREAELDLIEVTENVTPPIVKIMDYGKYLYQEQKRARESAKKTHTVETKNIQIGIGTSRHDLEMRAKKIEEFFKEGHRVKIDLALRGRAKYLDKNFLNERFDRLLHLLTEKYRIADGPKQAPRGLTLIIEKTK